MSDLAEIDSRIRELEAQLLALKLEVAQLRDRPHDAAQPTALADLSGFWQGEGDFSYEEIKAAEYSLTVDP